jgi:hypothetical protein
MRVYLMSLHLRLVSHRLHMLNFELPAVVPAVRPKILVVTFCSQDPAGPVASPNPKS